MIRKVDNTKHSIILLLILIAIGGVVMYGGHKSPRDTTSIIPHTEYEAQR